MPAQRYVYGVSVCCRLLLLLLLLSVVVGCSGAGDLAVPAGSGLGVLGVLDVFGGWLSRCVGVCRAHTGGEKAKYAWVEEQARNEMKFRSVMWRLTVYISQRLTMATI